MLIISSIKSAIKKFEEQRDISCKEACDPMNTERDAEYALGMEVAYGEVIDELNKLVDEASGVSKESQSSDIPE